MPVMHGGPCAMAPMADLMFFDVLWHTQVIQLIEIGPSQTGGRETGRTRGLLWFSLW